MGKARQQIIQWSWGTSEDYLGGADVNAEEAISILERNRFPGVELACVNIAKLIREQVALIAELEDKLRWRDLQE